jgi:hypothetical protein
MTHWIMTKAKDEGEYRFYIGAVMIVRLRFRKLKSEWVCDAHYLNEIRTYKNMSGAMKDMHARLNSPPTEATET